MPFSSSPTFPLVSLLLQISLKKPFLLYFMYLNTFSSKWALAFLTSSLHAEDNVSVFLSGPACTSYMLSFHVSVLSFCSSMQNSHCFCFRACQDRTFYSLEIITWRSGGGGKSTSSPHPLLSSAPYPT